MKPDNTLSFATVDQQQQQILLAELTEIYTSIKTWWVKEKYVCRNTILQQQKNLIPAAHHGEEELSTHHLVKINNTQQQWRCSLVIPASFYTDNAFTLDLSKEEYISFIKHKKKLWLIISNLYYM